MIFSGCVRHDAVFPVYGVAVGRMRWPDRYHPASGLPGECLSVRRVTLNVWPPLPARRASEVWERRAE